MVDESESESDSEPIARRPGQPGAPRPRREASPPGDSPTASALLRVELEPRFIRLAPGGSQTATLNVRNLGPLVDEVHLRLVGDAARWASVAPDTLRIYPNTEAQATIRLAPPRGPQPAAGLHELEIGLTSSTQPAASTVLRTSVDIDAFDNLSAAPSSSILLRGSGPAAIPIKVRNQGNRPATVRVEPSPMPGLDMDASAPELSLGPGAESTVWVKVRPQHRLWFGAPRLHPFTVAISSDHSPQQTIDGRLEQLPRFGARRLGVIGGAAAGMALLLVGLVAGGVIQLPGTGPLTATPSPTSSGVVTPTESPTASPTVSVPPSPTVSPTPLVTPSPTPSPTPTPTPSPTPTPTPSPTPTPTPTPLPVLTGDDVRIISAIPDAGTALKSGQAQTFSFRIIYSLESEVQARLYVSIAQLAAGGTPCAGGGNLVSADYTLVPQGTGETIVTVAWPGAPLSAGYVAPAPSLWRADFSSRIRYFGVDPDYCYPYAP